MLTMPRIEVDPTQVICPSFEDPEWEFLRQSIVDAHQGHLLLTLEGASQQLKDTWAHKGQQKMEAWTIQLQQDKAEQDWLDGETREAQEAQCIQQEKEDEELCKDADKKKLKLSQFDQSHQVVKWIRVRPATYALHKLSNLE